MTFFCTQQPGVWVRGLGSGSHDAIEFVELSSIIGFVDIVNITFKDTWRLRAHHSHCLPHV